MFVLKDGLDYVASITSVHAIGRVTWALNISKALVFETSEDLVLYLAACPAAYCKARIVRVEKITSPRYKEVESI